MLNTNLNLIGISSFDRFSQEESRGYIPFRLQYVLVSGGGGAAAGNNSFTSGSDVPKIGVAGSGGVIVTGSFCVEPFISYPITIGKGGAGGVKSTTTPIWTGSNGGNTIAFGITAFGGDGGKLQFYITASDYAGNGSGTSASLANGGSGSLWAYNLPGPPFPDGYGGGGTGGDYITNNYYAGGGAGIVVSGSVPTLPIEYIVVGGGGAGVNNQDTCNGGATFGGGGGAAITGSFVVEPIVRTYPIVVGAGGIGKYGCGPGTGSEAGTSTAFGVSAQGGRSGNSTDTIGGNSGTGSWGLTTPFLGSDAVSASAGAGGAGAAGTGSAVYQLSPGLWKLGNGGIGLQWVDGKYYAGGGGGGTQDATDFEGQPGLTSELIPSTQFYAGRGGTGVPGNFYFARSNGNSGSVVIRYPGTGSKATGGIIEYSGSYTYHYFTASGNFILNENTSSMFTSGLPGTGSLSYFSPSGSTSPQAYLGGGAAATYYNQNGVSGSDGVVVLRYEGAPLADGGQIITTQYYTYHVFTSSANLEVFGYESNPNVNPC